jgi:hypothetical protein
MMDSNTDGPGVCGFSFGRNLTKLNYPVEAAVGSVLPLCRRFVFAVGESDDDTRDRVAAIDTSAMDGGRGGTIDLVETTWPDVQVDGEVLAIEANKALDAAEAIAQADGLTWGFYIQADEVIHEDDHTKLAAAMRHWQDHDTVKALLFRYLHFVLDYQTIDPWMYHKASRIMRLDGSCRIYGDACGPGLPTYTGASNRDGYLDKRLLGQHVAWAAPGNESADLGRERDHWFESTRQPARVFHYGWVKTDQQLNEKFEMVDQLWWGTLDAEEKQRRKDNKFGRFIERYPALKKFHGSHPALMAQRIAAHRPYGKTTPRLLSPRFWAESFKHGLRF